MSVIVHEQIHQIKKTVIQRQKSSWNPTSSVLVALGSFNAYRVQHHKCCLSCSFFLRESSEHVHDRCRNSTCQHIHETLRQSALVSPRVVRIAACSTAGLPGVWVIHAGISGTIGHQDKHRKFIVQAKVQVLSPVHVCCPSKS